jgi:long-subunit acyl-CoA synthetase (AMP-forming)
MSNRIYNTQTRKKFLSGGQAKLDKDGDGKITGKDFAMLRGKKKNNKKKKTITYDDGNEGEKIMAFEYPSTITARKAKEKAKEKDRIEIFLKEQEYDDAFSSAKNVIKKLVEKDEDDIKIEIMGNQLD